MIRRLITNRLVACRRASAAVELALVLPVLMGLVLGAAELGRYVLLNARLEHAASGMADLAAREEALDPGKIADIFAAGKFLAAPFDLAANGRVLLSAVGRVDDGSVRVLWQREGAGTLGAVSTVGLPGGAAHLPSGFTPGDQETVVVAEVFYRYSPLLEPLIAPGVLRRAAYYRPRLSDLATIE